MVGQRRHLPKHAGECLHASGLHYKGTLVEAPVTLFASSDPSSARITTPIAKMGQMDSIVDEKTVRRFGIREDPLPQILPSMVHSTATLVWG